MSLCHQISFPGEAQLHEAENRETFWRYDKLLEMKIGRDFLLRIVADAFNMR